MPKVLETYEFHNFHGGGRQPKRDWTQWMDGAIYEFTQGEDFDETMQQFQTGLRNASRRLGLILASNVIDNRVVAQVRRVMTDPELQAYADKNFKSTYGRDNWLNWVAKRQRDWLAAKDKRSKEANGQA